MQCNMVTWYGSGNASVATLVSAASCEIQLFLFVFTSGSLAAIHMTPDNPGVWKLGCRVNSNLRGGMIAKYTVQKDCGNASAGQPMEGRKRWFYIAAVEETWDYAPSGKDLLEGVDLKDSM